MPELRDVDSDLLAEIIRNAIFAADDVVIGHVFPTRAAETRAAVTAAFRLAARNGLITLTPRDAWPESISLNAGREE